MRQSLTEIDPSLNALLELPLDWAAVASHLYRVYTPHHVRVLQTDTGAHVILLHQRCPLLALHLELLKDSHRANLWCMRRDADIDSGASTSVDDGVTIAQYETEHVAMLVSTLSHLLWKSVAASRFV